jgi:dTDP-4-amino-4,6-dideoxygalactose transaminase
VTWKVSLSEPDLGEDEVQAVTAVLRAKWLTMGSVTREFEERFAEKMGVKHAFAVNNGTAALHLANLALGITSGDEVICPALTFVASANASRYTGACPVFADVISEEDLTIDPQSILSCITPRTRAITVVHYGGFPCDMETILRIAREHGLKIIEDCAHAPFGRCTFSDGSTRFVGSVGDAGCFSFYGNKNMTTGEGGMITTNDDELAARIKLLRSHGMTSLAYERHSRHAQGYDVVMLGYNYRGDDLRSAIGLCQLRKIDAINAQRRKIFTWYADGLKNCSSVVVPFRNRRIEDSTCHIMPVIVGKGYTEVRDALNHHGIQTSKHYDQIPSFSIYSGQGFSSKVRRIGNVLTLPMYTSLKKETVDEICEIIKGCVP